jgi:hypothetical protein
MKKLLGKILATIAIGVMLGGCAETTKSAGNNPCPLPEPHSRHC